MTAFGGPSWVLLGLWIAWLVQALWCWYNVWGYRNRLGRVAGRKREQRKPFEPSVVVIVAVKGADDRFERHLEAMSRVSYPTYRVVYAVESGSEPAAAVVRRFADAFTVGPAGCRAIDLVVAGLATDEGQKVHNLLAALATLREEDEAVAFADADMVPPASWLNELIRPMRRPDRFSATTGYRWLMPAGGDDGGGGNLATLVASVLNASVATAQGPRWRCHAWGGSMAIRRSTIDDVGLEAFWRGALSDDYQLTRAMRAHGLPLRSLPSLLLESPVRHTWRSLWGFGRRQYMITRVYSPFVWLLALLLMWLYTAGWVSVIAATAVGAAGWGWGWAAWTAVWLADLGRAGQRRRLIRDVFGEATVRRLSGVLRLERWATPLWMLVHGLIIASSAFGRTIRWAGVGYVMRGRQRLRVVRDG